MTSVANPGALSIAGAGVGPDDHAIARYRYAHPRGVLVQLAEVTEHLGAINRKIGIYVDRLEANAAPFG